MESITVEQIENTLKMIAGIITSLTVILGIFSMWYKKKIANKFDEIEKKYAEVEKKIVEIESRLKYVEEKRDEYEKEIGNSKEERGLLARGELAALKILRVLVDESKLDKDEIAESIKKIEEFVMKKSH